MVTVGVEGHDMEMLLDTGAIVSIVPEKLYRDHLSHLPMRQAPGFEKLFRGQGKLAG